jgi:hypothetical protein
MRKIAAINKLTNSFAQTSLDRIDLVVERGQAMSVVALGRIGLRGNVDVDMVSVPALRSRMTNTETTPINPTTSAT